MYVYLLVYRFTEQLISVFIISKDKVIIQCYHNNYCCVKETKLFLYKVDFEKELLPKRLPYMFLSLPALDTIANQIKMLQIISFTSINLQRTLLIYSINVQDDNGTIKRTGKEPTYLDFIIFRPGIINIFS
jgi:hypothetical protein